MFPDFLQESRKKKKEEKKRKAKGTLFVSI
jgi:hypothetical protein